MRVVGCVPQSAAESDSASLEPVYEQQKRMGTLPEKLLADTAYGSQAHVEMSAEIGIQLVSPAGGTLNAETQCVAAGIQTEGNPLAAQEASQKKDAGMSPTMRRLPEDLGRRQTSALLPPRFSRRQRATFSKVSRSATCRYFVFAPASRWDKL